MIDRSTKILLAIIAFNLTIIAADRVGSLVLPSVQAAGPVDVRIIGGRLDYETDVSGGPTLKVCTQC